MPGIIPEVGFDYWIIRHQTEKNKSVIAPDTIKNPHVLIPCESASPLNKYHQGYPKK